MASQRNLHLFLNFKSGVQALTTAIALAAGLLFAGQASAAVSDLTLVWTNKNNPADFFTGQLSFDSKVLAPVEGLTNLAKTDASLSITVPQTQSTYTMKDFQAFQVGISQATIAKAHVGENLISENLVGRAVIFGALNTNAFYNFNGCDNNFGVCFNRFGSGPVYNLSSVTVSAPVPEPETYAMLLAGLGLLGFVARRKA